MRKAGNLNILILRVNLSPERNRHFEWGSILPATEEVKF